jgi:hypothetical protein
VVAKVHSVASSPPPVVNLALINCDGGRSRPSRAHRTKPRMISRTFRSDPDPRNHPSFSRIQTGNERNGSAQPNADAAALSHYSLLLPLFSRARKEERLGGHFLPADLPAATPARESNSAISAPPVSFSYQGVWSDPRQLGAVGRRWLGAGGSALFSFLAANAWIGIGSAPGRMTRLIG